MSHLGDEPNCKLVLLPEQLGHLRTRHTRVGPLSFAEQTTIPEVSRAAASTRLACPASNVHRTCGALACQCKFADTSTLPRQPGTNQHAIIHMFFQDWVSQQR